MAAVHDHANNIRTVGLGEVSAVLNGYAFRTRHNDYRLKMPDTESSQYHATKDVPFPPVPESVLQYEGNIPEQVSCFSLVDDFQIPT